MVLDQQNFMFMTIFLFLHLFMTDIFFSLFKYRRAPEGSSHKLNAQRDLLEVMSHRLHIDNSIELIGKLLFGSGKASELLKSVRTAGQPLVDDWSCLKSMVSRLIGLLLNNFGLTGLKCYESFGEVFYASPLMVYTAWPFTFRIVCSQAWKLSRGFL